MNLNLIDIHCHLDFPDFDKDREEIIKKTLDKDVWMITVGANMETSRKAVQIAESHKGIWATVGVHPHDADKKIDWNEFRELAKHQKVVAIGECGLDFFRNQEAQNSKFEIRNKQKEIFEKQIKIALELNKPLMIHCREAHKEVLEIVSSSKFHASRLRAHIHFFTGTWEEAQKYLELGFSLSFDGPITFSSDYDETIRKMPLDKIMVETDAPFVAPIPYRGRRCEPLYVEEMVKKIAKVKELSFEEVAKVTTANAIAFFGLK